MLPCLTSKRWSCHTLYWYDSEYTTQAYFSTAINSTSRIWSHVDTAIVRKTNSSCYNLTIYKEVSFLINITHTTCQEYFLAFFLIVKKLRVFFYSKIFSWNKILLRLVYEDLRCFNNYARYSVISQEIPNLLQRGGDTLVRIAEL